MKFEGPDKNKRKGGRGYSLRQMGAKGRQIHYWRKQTDIVCMAEKVEMEIQRQLKGQGQVVVYS